MLEIDIKTPYLFRVLKTKMILEVGVHYRLCLSQTDYKGLNALYAGSYTHEGKTSHRFVHVVKLEDYVNFVANWVCIGHSVVVDSNDIYSQDSTIFYTDIYDEKLEKGVVLMM